MNAGLALRAAISLLAVVCFGYTTFFLQPGEFPFDWRTVDAHTLVIEPRQDRELPPRIRAGDRLDLRQQDFRTRTSLYTTSLPGESYVLALERAGSPLRVTVAKVAPDGSGGSGHLFDVTLLLVLVLGLSTLWWGRDWAAWGLSVFAFATLANFFLFLMPLPPVPAFIAVLLNQALVATLLPVGLYVSALMLAGPAVSGRLRTSSHFVFFAVLGLNAVLLGATTVRYIIYGDALLERTGIVGVLFAVSICLPLALLLVALPRADAARRLRIRWILFSLVLFIGPIAWNNLAQFSEALTTRGIVRQAVWWTALLGGLAGLVYAVLRKRVVAMSFAINRALVYGIVVALVIGVFGALTALIENTAIGADAGLALTVAVSVVIGLVLEAVRDRVNLLVERLFFRRRYEAETALRRFARDCAGIENADRLLDATTETIRAHINPDGQAIYSGPESGYRRVRSQGAGNWPVRLDVDDPALVAMRTTREAVDLRGTGSALGADGLAFPMIVAGSLSGALVCGPRNEEYTRDERRLLADVAQQVGTALHARRAREHEAIVRALAAGEIEPHAARERARAAFPSVPTG